MSKTNVLTIGLTATLAALLGAIVSVALLFRLGMVQPNTVQVPVKVLCETEDPSTICGGGVTWETVPTYRQP